MNIQREQRMVVRTIGALEAIDSSKTSDEVFEHFSKFTLEISIETFAYHILSEQLKQLPYAESLQSHSFSEEWIEHYQNQNYYQIDPIVQKAAESLAPFHWYELDDADSIMHNQSRMLSELKDQGFVDGLAVPVFGPDKVTAYFGLGSYDDELDFSAKELTAVQIVCQNTHLKCFSLAASAKTDKIKLSKRENEILKWIANGKSNDVIGHILGISKHTVDTHVKRILTKLGTSSRITAVVSALQAGILKL